MNVSSRYWSRFYANDCVFSRNEQQKVYYPTPPCRVQITPKTSTNITRYLHSRGPVRQACLLLTNQLAGFPAPILWGFLFPFNSTDHKVQSSCCTAWLPSSWKLYNVYNARFQKSSAISSLGQAVM